MVILPTIPLAGTFSQYLPVLLWDVPPHRDDDGYVASGNHGKKVYELIVQNLMYVSIDKSTAPPAWNPWIPPKHLNDGILLVFHMTQNNGG